MRAVGLCTLAITACASAPSEALRDPVPLKKPAPDPVVTYEPPPERPEFDIPMPAIRVDVTLVEPDPTRELRWPLALSDHPELEPQFDIARVLAEPGLDWIELCKLGAHRRIVPKLRDQLAYLRAWCLVGAHDYPAAIESLVKLRSTVVKGLRPAIRADLSNILVTHDPDSARELVSTFGLSGEIDILDRLAATYVEVGKLGGAIEINELALANDSGASPAKTCQRLTRRVLLEPNAYRRSESAFTRARPIPGFDDDPTPLLFGAKLNADAQCKELDAELSCWLVKGNCSAWYQMRGVSELDAYLLAASNAWPTGAFRAKPEAWWHVIQPAVNARPKREAYQFALLAAEAAIKLTECDHVAGIDRVRGVLAILRDDKRAPADVVSRIQWIEDNLKTLCLQP